jgi:hypothetical protein
MRHRTHEAVTSNRDAIASTPRSRLVAGETAPSPSRVVAPCRPQPSATENLACRIARVLRQDATGDAAMTSERALRPDRFQGAPISGIAARKQPASSEAASLLKNFGLAHAMPAGGIWTHVRGESTPRPRANELPLTHERTEVFIAAQTATGSSPPQRTSSQFEGVRETRIDEARPATRGAGENDSARVARLDDVGPIPRAVHDKEVGP